MLQRDAILKCVRYLAQSLDLHGPACLTWQISPGRGGVGGAPAAPRVTAVRGQGHGNAWTV